jgi:lysine 2,3-aminomutase
VLISQSVLLRGVNADVETLSALMRAFVENRVKPYYLHHPDLAPGTAQFRLSLEEGQALVKSLRGHLSGLCQPTYILDIPGGAGKIPVGPAFLSGCETPGAEAFAEDRHGERHRYPPD